MIYTVYLTENIGGAGCWSRMVKSDLVSSSGVTIHFRNLRLEFTMKKLFIVKAILYPRGTKWFSLQNIEFSSEESLQGSSRTNHLYVFGMDQLYAFLEQTPRVALGYEDESSESCEVVQSYNVERSSDVLILDNNIKWDNIGTSAVKELKCPHSFPRTQNQIAVLINNVALFESTKCEDFKGFGYIFLLLKF